MKTAFLLVVILDDLDRLPNLLAAWREIGVGSTLVRSQGGYRVASWLDRIGLRGLQRLLDGDDSVHAQQLMLSLIQEEALLERAIGEAERVLGGFDRPHSGLLFTLPVGHMLGASKWAAPAKPPEPERWVQVDKKGFTKIDPKTPVSDIMKVLNLTPCHVRRTDSIPEVLRVMLKNPSVKVIGVVNDDLHLVGVLETKALSDSLMFSVFPEAYFSDFRDVDEVMDFVKQPHNVQVAGDLMKEPVSVRLDDTLKKAFDRMHKHKLAGIPVVDNQNQIVGHINLLELLAICFLNEDVKGGTGEEAGHG